MCLWSWRGRGGIWWEGGLGGRGWGVLPWEGGILGEFDGLRVGIGMLTGCRKTNQYGMFRDTVVEGCGC